MGYWFKVGVGFALGAATVSVTAWVVFVVLILPVLLRALARARF